MKMPEQFAIVDLFAGPGGLAEGFAAVDIDGWRPFSIALSIEREDAAHATLRLRNFLRKFGREFPPEYYDFLNGKREEPAWDKLYPKQWRDAENETLKVTLGSRSAAKAIEKRLVELRRRHKDNTVLIGGPPCQAYSLVGRARNKGIKGYDARNDRRHFLYREYIRILRRLRPAAFVMENVKGLLSSTVGGQPVLEKVLRDLRSSCRSKGGYQLVALTREAGDRDSQPAPSDFVIQAEQFGIPQKRHRLIIAGVRRDIASASERDLEFGAHLSQRLTTPTVRHVLEGMPNLRSAISREVSDEAAWRDAVADGMRKASKVSLALPGSQLMALHARAKMCAESFSKKRPNTTCLSSGAGSECPNDLRRWLFDSRMSRLPNNESRAHMAADLHRYFFAAIFAEITGRSPKARDFPPELAPMHKNWLSDKFVDRFRVQLWDSPASTVTAHISKDGHYFIHPDPLQCRSLTVREAARLQTFPDNYFFKGNRTQQFIQVGNAVPPYLAFQVAHSILGLLDVRSFKTKYDATKYRGTGISAEVSSVNL